MTHIHNIFSIEAIVLITEIFKLLPDSFPRAPNAGSRQQQSRRHISNQVNVVNLT